MRHLRRASEADHGSALALCLTLVVSACGAASSEPASNTGVVRESTEVHALSSSFQEQDYRLHVALPQGYGESEQRYPVLYLLDSDLLFGLTADVARLLALESIFLEEQVVPALIVVGIGFPGGMAEMAEKRGWDFNPQPDGRADLFAQFVQEDVFPFVETTYRVDPADRTVVGASRAGLFVLYSLFAHPGDFQRYLAISPTVEPVVLTLEEAFAQAPDNPSARLFLASGDAGEIEGQIAAGVDRLRGVLEARGYATLQLTSRRYPGESHVSVLPAALVHGLKALFAPAAGEGSAGEGA